MGKKVNQHNARANGRRHSTKWSKLTAKTWPKVFVSVVVVWIGVKMAPPSSRCQDVTDLFPPPLPVSPNKVSCNMTDVNNQNHTCFQEAGKRFNEALSDDAISNSLVWMQLAMPSTASTTVDHLMALGGNMAPLLRAGGCSHACVDRIGPSQVPAISDEYSTAMGFPQEQLQKCEPRLFRRLSSLVRCPQSGIHMDYTKTQSLSKMCLALAKAAPELKGNIQVNPHLLNDKVVIGTTLRHPIQYHYKEYKHWGPPDWRDSGICQLWAEKNVSGVGNTFGFSCTNKDCAPGVEEGAWCTDANFQAYMRFAHHRWNLFTRTIAGTLVPKHNPVNKFEDASSMHKKHFLRERALRQNELGAEDPDYKLAVARLEAMPHFSIFERMSESIELLCFTYCYNCTALEFEYKPKKTREPVPDDIAADTSRYHNLDLMLYKHANKLFTRRLEWMREQKAKGVQCDLLLSGCGLTCKD